MSSVVDSFICPAVEHDSNSWKESNCKHFDNVLNGQAVSNVSNKSRLCKFFNEGSCSHESHHGVYQHFCSSCFKNGHSLTHPEVECSVKLSFKPQENAVPLR